MQVTTRRVQTGELGEQVSYPLPGKHMTVGKNRMRQRSIQRSLSHGSFSPLCHKGLFESFFFNYYSLTRLHKTAEMQSERRFWIEMGTSQTHHTQMETGS